MNIKPEFSLIFEKLKSILQPYSQKLIVKTDTVDNFSLDGAYSAKWKKELFFGAAQVRKNYVSFYLMPVYMYPDLLENVSPELKKHMQGKSCFNFKKIEPAPFDELAQLTRQAYKRFTREEYSQHK
ncbi:hypothetical protein ANAEL_02129 [Anaerolineales bacterium]|nr:hypothetical protein ANAEL_02129 [Anaerolineales bacterium]